MSDFNGGGAAFPSGAIPIDDHGGTIAREEGMTLRDYFAAKAMQGSISNSADDRKSYAEYAERSYKMADAMLRAREHQK